VVLLLGAPIGVLDLGAERHRIDLAKMLFFWPSHAWLCLPCAYSCVRVMKLGDKFVRTLAVHWFPLMLCTG
jgi:hypothetical protein